MAKITPMMQQYFEIKEQYKHCLLFFRLGDFYEMFFEDAVIASKELEITLTGKDWGQEERAPMCGVPFHSADGYIARLVERGYRLADSMSTEKIFPNMLVQMVAIGEDSGAIDKMLSSAGRAYDEEAQSMAKQLTSLLEPLMILFLGVVVGFMVLGLYMPMFSMFDAMNATA